MDKEKNPVLGRGFKAFVSRIRKRFRAEKII